MSEPLPALPEMPPKYLPYQNTQVEPRASVAYVEALEAYLQRAAQLLERSSDMLSAVAGDIEDAGSLGDMSGKYVAILVNVRDDARAFLSRLREVMPK